MNKNTENENKSDKKHICLQCGSSFNRPYRLTQHLLLHNNIKLFVCGETDCKKSYTSKSHLDRHLYSVHIKPDFDVINRCPECMKIFSNRQNLKRHMKIKHAKKVGFTCDICRSVFKKKHQLSAHMYQHTFVKSFSCDLCGKEFISLQERKKHMKFHKTYNCNFCNMSFNHWSKYQKHKKEEHNNKEYICNECGRKFKQRGHLVHHIKTHLAPSVLKTFSCWFENCDRVYTRKSNLKQHMDSKHLQITHKCEICQAQLSTKAKLKAHLLTHRSENVKHHKPKSAVRKDRKDKGTFKSSTALKIAGLLVDPETKDMSNLCFEPASESEPNKSPKSEVLETVEDCEAAKIINAFESTIKEVKSSYKMEIETPCETITSLKPIAEREENKNQMEAAEDQTVIITSSDTFQDSSLVNDTEKNRKGHMHTLVESV